MIDMSSKTLGTLLGLTAFSILAFGDTCIKALTSYYDIYAVGFYLNIFTILFLIPVIIRSGGLKKSLETHSLKFHILRSFFMLGIYLTIIYALSVLPLTKAYTIAYTMPFILNILAIAILKEQISIYRWLAIITAFIGILIALRPGIVPLNAGAMAAFANAFFLASAIITVKFIDTRDKWPTYILYPMFIQTPVLGLILLLKNQPLLPEWSLSPWLWMIAGGLAFAVGLSLLPQAIKRANASIFGALIYITFIWGTLYGYFIFKDVVDLWTAVGAVIIISAGLFLIYREKIEDSKLLKMDE